MNVLSLFAGIGGLELGLERVGMRVVGQVEMGADESAWDSMTEEYRDQVRAELDDFLTVDGQVS